MVIFQINIINSNHHFMVKKSEKKAPKKPSKGKKRTASKSASDFELNKTFYDTVEQHTVFKTEKRVAKIFGARNKKTGEELVSIKFKSKTPYGWNYNRGVNLFSALHIDRLIQALRSAAKKLGWRVVDEAGDIEKLKKQLRAKEEAIITLEEENEEERAAHSKLMQKFRLLQEKELRSRQKEFQKDVQDLKTLLGNTDNIPEDQLQEFLFDHPWLFGTEYISSEPQKMRGAHSRFDFYLERFNKTNDIIEIKLISDPIVKKDGAISAKVIQAVDQLIGYMESATAAAHSTVISKEEGITELRPRGIVIIGGDNSPDAIEKLRAWNYQFAHITIFTYFDILEKAQATLKYVSERSEE